MKVRIRFRKYGPLKFIGHLDVMRYFQKALRRAGIDVAYSSGFSPHPVMSFASPLGVGLESNGEYVDIELNSPMGSDDLLKRLNGAGVCGIEAVSARQLPEKAGNAMASVAAAKYTVRFREGRGPRFDCAKAVSVFLSRESIMVQKETKKGVREVDLRPGIYTFSFCEKDGSLSMLVNASSAGNIKPCMLIGALFAANGDELQKNALLVTREDLYAKEGTADEPSFVSLDEIGFRMPSPPAEGAGA